MDKLTRIFFLIFFSISHNAYSDILVSYENEISIYSSSDFSLISSTPVDQPSAGWEARDIIRLPDGRVAIFNGGGTDITLSIWNPSNSSWLHFTYPDWGLESNITYGGITTDDKYIYVTDGRTGDNGIIRFDQNTGSAQRFLSNLNTGYIDLTMGLDGYLYALRNTNGDLDKIDPATMALVTSIDLGLGSSSRAIAVDQDGVIYMASFDGYVAKHGKDGTNLSTSPIFGIGFWDIDVHPSGQLLLSDTEGNVYYRYTDLSAIKSFSFNSKSEGGFVAYYDLDALDTDSDGIRDNVDNCPATANEDQADRDENNIGDACQFDDDILDFLPAIIAGIEKKPPPPPAPAEWLIENRVYCSSNFSEWNVSDGKNSRKSRVITEFSLSEFAGGNNVSVRTVISRIQ